jgi:hypothetical protein
MLAVEEATQQTRPSSNRRTKASVASNRPDQCTTGGSTGPASKRTLLRFGHARTPSHGDECDNDTR